ncbi:PAS domain-containing sensor histidine kinase [Actinopolymorpha sp. B17G11]|uniref:PAS domain-containing sensor histidine kinase n=1 Tax=Actinopolymorpha sp. B17G11 TaxID=3160861 RepID=UPI0032E4321F
MAADAELTQLRAALRRCQERMRERELSVAELNHELQKTNRGFIAVHAELEDARQAEARLAAIVQSSDDAMLALGPELTIQTWSPGAQRLLGYRSDEIVGHSMQVLVADESPPQFDAAVGHVRAGRRVQAYDTRWRHREGTPIDVGVAVAAMREVQNLDLIGFSVVARDISHRLRTQAELAEARALQEVMNDRDRIARDLHDMVIQRVFAAEMMLHSAATLVIRPEVAERIETVIGELDGAIQDLRTTIFALHGGWQRSTSVRGQVLDLATAAQDGLGFSPNVRFDGPVDTTVTDEVAVQVLAVLREALTNIARHAQASSASVVLKVADGEVVLQVADDGRGFDTARHQGGLRNFRERAESHGGRFELHSELGAGTRIDWRIPLSR